MTHALAHADPLVASMLTVVGSGLLIVGLVLGFWWLAESLIARRRARQAQAARVRVREHGEDSREWTA